MKSPALNMLQGSIWDKLPQFALPLAATAILEQLFNAADVAVVGRFTGELSVASVAAVGANSFVISLLITLFIGLSLGATVVIANAIGRGDAVCIRRAVHTAIAMAFIGGVLVLAIGELSAAALLRMLSVPHDVFPLALLYLRIYLLGMPVILLYNFAAAVFRSVGDTRTPLLALLFAGILNVFLNLFFVIGLHMTVDGVAIATILSNSVSALYLLRRLQASTLPIRLKVKLIRIDRDAFLKILRIGFPAGIQGAMFSISNLVLQRAINSLGPLVMAASCAAFNVEVFAYVVLNAFSQACTAFVGQNVGAKQFDRCKRIFWICLGEDILATALAIFSVLLIGRHILSFFNTNPEVIELGYTRLIFVFAAYTFTTCYEIFSGYLRGFGISLTPALLTVFGVCGVRICWIHWGFPHFHTFRSIMAAYPISLSITARLLLCALLYYRPTRRFRPISSRNPV